MATSWGFLAVLQTSLKCIYMNEKKMAASMVLIIHFWKPQT